MRIDRNHRAWAVVSSILLIACGAWYWRYATSSARGATGSSWTGLFFGFLGSAFILFAMLKAPRRWMRTLRIGSAQFWMRGHLWLGTLALPMIWFHGGFHHGGTLTTVLMWLMYIIVFSGLIGAALQHWLPKQMTASVQRETVYEQIPQMLEHLRAEAELAVSAAGPLDNESIDTWKSQRKLAIKSRFARGLMSEAQYQQLMSETDTAPVANSMALKSFYADSVRRYLADDGGGFVALADKNRAGTVFTELIAQLPSSLQHPITELKRICDERRDLSRQESLHRILHGWLLIHIPLSMALLVLGIVHAVMALMYA